MNSLRQYSANRMVRQQGMTTAGLIIMVSFIGLFVYAGIRLTPAYLENFKVANTLTSVEESLGGKNASRRDILSAIEKRFDVEGVNVISFKDVTMTKVADGWSLEADYVNTVPFLANISFAVEFNNQITVVR
ncbi:MAG: DUF4845 domain-containing protein [Pseudomonadota bacterium]